MTVYNKIDPCFLQAMKHPRRPKRNHRPSNAEPIVAMK